MPPIDEVDRQSLFTRIGVAKPVAGFHVDIEIDQPLMLQEDPPEEKAPRHRTDCGTRLSLWVS